LACGSSCRNASAGVTDATVTAAPSPTSLQIQLPTPVHPSQSVYLQATGAHLEAKITAIPTEASEPSLIPSQPLSAPELRQLRPNALCCAVCDREVANLTRASGSDSGYKDLPSEYWAEMMEVWMCHADPAWTAKIAERSKEGFWPEKGRVLVGGSYLLVHPQDSKLDHLTIESMSNVSPLPDTPSDHSLPLLD
jgi:hypothetical protein